MNYLELRASLETHLQTQDEPSFAAQIDSFIIQTEQRIIRTLRPPFAWDLSDGNIDLIPNNAFATLPPDTLDIYYLAIKEAGEGSDEVVPLHPVDDDYILEAYPIPTNTGQPYHYSKVSATTVRLGPTPDAAYPLVVHRLFFPESITTANNTWIGDNYEKALLYGTLSLGYMYLKGDPDLQARYDQHLMDELQFISPEATPPDRDQAGVR